MTGVASLVFACAAACYAKAEIEQTCTEVGLCTGRPANGLLQAKTHMDANDSYTTQFYWDNSWDGNLHMTCPRDQWWYGMESMYSTRRDDRVFKMRCGGRKDARQGNVEWHGWANDWDDEMIFNCPPNEAIAGMASTHDDRTEDRKFKFLCTKVDSPYEITTGSWSEWVNEWQQWAGYPGRGCSIQAGNVITGVYSEHSNKKEDRKWQFQCGGIHKSETNQCVKCKNDQTCCKDDKVKTQWTTFEGGDGNLYNGDIKKTFQDGSITVNYDDGSTWTGDATQAEKLR